MALLIAGAFVSPLFMPPNPRLLHTRTPAAVGLAFEDVSFPAADAPLTLRGWLMPAPDAKATLVMAHGGGEDNRSLPYGEGLELMRDLVGNGYSVLAMDLRNFGESDASPD
ncbi:MAG TPA: alpha/beta hydrolase, partial [Candidatus Binatia bacterium]|nr:alpha/beta hydrolase [Candidatus Binatia bacterium]